MGSIDEPSLEDEDLASLTLLDSQERIDVLARLPHSSVMEERDPPHLLNVAFTTEHLNLGLPRDGKIEENRVYDLTEVLDIEVPGNLNPVETSNDLNHSYEEIRPPETPDPADRRRRRFIPNLKWKTFF